jgi:hypothetical protein
MVIWTRPEQKSIRWKGIAAGKDAASQEGFGDGFANADVPIGPELCLLQGIAKVSPSNRNSSKGRGNRRGPRNFVATVQDTIL